MKRLSFLLLQGPATPFFARLADTLLEQGHRVCKVNFCAGDALFRTQATSVAFNRPFDEWDGFLSGLLELHGIDRVLLFGDCRPLHMQAIVRLKQRSIPFFVYEEGYFRPNWITLEAGGTNAFSGLPRDPAWYLKQAKEIPVYADGDTVGGSLKARAGQDMAYHLANITNALRFPHYRTHRPHASHIEYLGWARRFPQLPWRERKAQHSFAQIQAHRRPFYLFPLQLDADYQIKVHSRFDGISQAISEVMQSFASQAAADAVLLIKNHPLDTGLINYRAHIRTLATQLDLGNRVVFIDGGHLPTLLHHCRGVITINSTVGLSALYHGRPTIALGQSIYNLPGLCFQDSLDAFWKQQKKPDRALFHAFRNTVIHRTQLNGGYYNTRGIELAIAGSVRRLTHQNPLSKAEPNYTGVPSWEG
ncbi:capsule biosynthesis protein [Marinobacterium sedimentorum]|uniref:capsule biosynthesis protein n=1 Tax=Marinobacterium sedimentorum TaxID=2927804 RepID=UPI0020C61A9C|nr:capsular biosynthesis protein [Marinobacterium sedimentorum]MCP8688157.1 capsular biosynthesis protein [Marinobacterium sedimentorum]